MAATKVGPIGSALGGGAEMTAVTPIHAFTADHGLAWQRPRRRQGFDRVEAPDSPDDARISRRLVYPMLAAVSLLLWFALAWLVILAIRLPLFS
jgi:hypothetical protein